MRKPTTIMLAVGLLGMSFVQTGCFGNFALTRKVYNFNEGVSDSRFVQTLVFWVLNIIPVYGVASWIDLIILNLIEFWTGSNPMAMNEGEVEKQLVHLKGVNYEITATKNKMSFAVLSGKDAGKQVDLVYTPENSTWSAITEGRTIEVCSIIGEENGVPVARFNLPDGTFRDVAVEEANFAMFRSSVADYTAFAAK